MRIGRQPIEGRALADVMDDWRGRRGRVVWTTVEELLASDPFAALLGEPDWMKEGARQPRRFNFYRDWAEPALVKLGLKNRYYVDLELVAAPGTYKQINEKGRGFVADRPYLRRPNGQRVWYARRQLVFERTERGIVLQPHESGLLREVAEMRGLQLPVGVTGDEGNYV